MYQVRGNPRLDGLQSGPERRCGALDAAAGMDRIVEYSAAVPVAGRVRLSHAFSTSSVKAGEGIRTLDVQLGRLSLYH